MNVYDCLHMFTVYENSYSIFLAEPLNHERRHHDVTKRYGWYEGIDLMNHPNMIGDLEQFFPYIVNNHPN